MKWLSADGLRQTAILLFGVALLTMAAWLVLILSYSAWPYSTLSQRIHYLGFALLLSIGSTVMTQLMFWRQATNSDMRGKFGENELGLTGTPTAKVETVTTTTVQPE